MRTTCYAIYFLVMLGTFAFADVTVNSPVNGTIVTSPVPYAATAISKTCSQGVASMGIYVNNQLVYVQNGSSLKTNLHLNPGIYKTVVDEWDNCGGTTFTPAA